MKWNIVNGTAYNMKTPNGVIQTLENARLRGKRVRIFFGDQNTGADWMEEFRVIGQIGRSTGEIKVPLLITNSRSLGGAAIMDSCIVKITIDKYPVYEHPNYHQPHYEIRQLQYSRDGVLDDYTHRVCNAAGESIANFESFEKADCWLQFMRGERNSK